MSFLVPSVLWGLIAAAIPLLIHLFSIRRTQTVDFSSIQFIKELEHETIRRLKIRQLILLLLRTLAIILIVLSFARPVKTGYFPVGSSQFTQMIFLIDNSASMSASNEEDKLLLAMAKEKVKEILQTVEGEMHLQLWQTNPLKRIFSGKFHSVDVAAGHLESIHESADDDNLWNAIDSILVRSAWEAEGGDIFANREFYLFSDLPSTVPADWQFREVGQSTSSNWHVFLFPSDKAGDNLSIKESEILTELRVAGQLVEIQCSIENQGDGDLKDTPVELYFGDTPVGHAVSDIPAGKLKEFIFQAYPSRSEIVEGTIIIPTDHYRYDNKRYFRFSVPEKINCIISGSSDEQISLMEMALDAMNSDSVFIQHSRHNLTQISMLQLSDADILILMDPEPINMFVAEQIAEFQELGGGILAFLGEKSKYEGNQLLNQLGLKEIDVVDSVAEGSFYSIEARNNLHPIIEGLSIRDLDRTMPEIYSSLKIVPEKESKAILTMSNDSPLLLHSEKNNTFVFSIPLTMKWSSLPTSGLFLPLLHRLLIALVAADDALFMFVVGENVQLPLEEEYLSTEIEMVKPSGDRLFLIPNYRNESVIIDDLNEPGIYRLLSDGKQVMSFVANILESEDPLRRLPVGELDKLFPGGRVITPEEDIVTAVTEARRGTELWFLFIIAAAAALLAETWIGRVRKEKPDD